MKRILFALTFLFVASMAFGQRYVAQSFADTCTNAETITFTVDDKIYEEGVGTWYFAADSVSGTGNGTGYVEVAYGPAGGDWHRVDTITLAGSATTNYYSADLVGVRTRITLTGSGTSVSALRAYFIFKRRQ